MNDPSNNNALGMGQSNNDSFGSTQDERAAGRIAHPSDAETILEITFTFSITVEEYIPPPQESTGIEDTQPHDMTLPIALNNTDRSLVINNVVIEDASEIPPQRSDLDNFTANNHVANLTNNVGERDRTSQDILEQTTRQTGACVQKQRSNDSNEENSV